MSYASGSPKFESRLTYPNTYRASPSSTSYSKAKAALIKYYGWNRVAILHQYDPEFFSPVEYSLKLAKNNVSYVTPTPWCGRRRYACAQHIHPGSNPHSRYCINIQSAHKQGRIKDFIFGGGAPPRNDHNLFFFSFVCFYQILLFLQSRRPSKVRTPLHPSPRSAPEKIKLQVLRTFHSE